MQELMRIKVQILDNYVVDGSKLSVAMIPFTAEAEGDYFKGKLIGQGVDTQKIEKDKPALLSARYMLEGQDYTGKKCRIFIENNGSDWNHCVPMIVTDSEALKDWETDSLYDTVELIEGGVMIRIYKEQ